MCAGKNEQRFFEKKNTQDSRQKNVIVSVKWKWAQRAFQPIKKNFWDQQKSAPKGEIAAA